MPMTPYSGDVEIITNIGTTPQERGLSTDEFKAKFDEGLKAFVTWFNDTHKTEFDAHLADIAAHGDTLNIYRSDKDANDIFTKIEWKLPNDKLAKKSVLSGGTSPKYTTRTVTYYESDGVTVKLSKSYTITYDTNDDMTSEVTT